jgi:hypothetical protein
MPNEYNTNNLGTSAHYGVRTLDTGAGSAKTEGTRTEIRQVINLPGLATAATANNTFIPQATIPAGAYIESAKLIPIVSATSEGAATLTIGLYYKDTNGAIATLDADGIDATIALTALQTDDAPIAADGALVAGATLATTADEYYINSIYATAAFTAGEAELVVTYILPKGNA